MKQINIEFKDNESKYITIYKHIKRMIVDGRLESNEKLPSKRALSENLLTSLNTIMSAYDLLLSEGYIYSVEKSGYYVTDNKYFNKKESNEDIEESINYMYDFTNETIDTSIFPYFTIRKITQNLMLDNPSIWLKKSNYQGDIELRKTIAEYLYENKGMEVNKNNIIIVSSLEESLSIVSSVININKIGIEDPCYLKVYNYFKEKEIILFEVDDNGIVLDREDPLDLLYVTPYNQFPTGVKMSKVVKNDLLKYPVKYIFEDDFDCDLISQNKVMSTLYSLNNTKVIYHGSFSHTICPGLRISYLVLPSDLIIRYKEKYKDNSSKISSLDQALVNIFLKEGYYYRHLTKIKKTLSRKKIVIRNYLVLKKISYTETALSFIVYIDKKNKNLIEDIAKNNKIKINFISKYRIKQQEADSVVINYMSIDESKIINGLELIFGGIKNENSFFG